MERRYVDRLILLCLLLLSCSLLFLCLSDPSLSVDEFVNVEIDELPVSSILRRLAEGNDLHPPLSHVISSFWIGLLGQQEWSVRSIWAFVGVLTVAATYRVGEHLATRKVGMLSALLTCCLSTFLLYTRFVKYYSLTMCLSVLVALAFLRWYERPLSWVRSLEYGTLLLTYLYTDYFGPAMWLLFSNLIVLARCLSGREESGHQYCARWIAAQICVFVGWLPWIGFASRQARVVIHNLARADISSGLLAVIVKVAYGVYSFSVGETLYPWHLLVVVGGLISAVSLLRTFHIHSWWCQSPSTSWAAVFSIISILGIAVLLSTVIQGVPFVAFANHILFVLPFYSVWLASGILRIRNPYAASSTLAIVMVMRLVGILNYYEGSDFHNPIYVVPTRAIVEELAELSGPDELVIAAPDTGVRFYAERTSDWTAELSSPSEVGIALDRERPDRVWLFVFGRDRTRNSQFDQAKILLDSRCILDYERGYVESSPLYQKVKSLLFDRPSYRFKLSLYSYDCRGEESD